MNENDKIEKIVKITVGEILRQYWQEFPDSADHGQSEEFVSRIYDLCAEMDIVPAHAIAGAQNFVIKSILKFAEFEEEDDNLD